METVRPLSSSSAVVWALFITSCAHGLDLPQPYCFVPAAGITERGPDYLVIQWNKPTNATVTGYEVGIQTVDGFRQGKMIVYTFVSSIGGARLTNLSPNTAYRIIVRPKTRQGQDNAYSFDAKTTAKGSTTARSSSTSTSGILLAVFLGVCSCRLLQMPSLE